MHVSLAWENSPHFVAILSSGLGVKGPQQFLNFSSGRACCSSAKRSVLSGAFFKGQVLVSKLALCSAELGVSLRDLFVGEWR